MRFLGIDAELNALIRESKPTLDTEQISPVFESITEWLDRAKIVAAQQAQAASRLNKEPKPVKKRVLESEDMLVVQDSETDTDADTPPRANGTIVIDETPIDPQLTSENIDAIIRKSEGIKNFDWSTFDDYNL